MKSRLELTTDELRFTLLALADADQVRGNVAIGSAANKLRRQWVLRHETHSPHWETVKLEEVRNDFRAVGLSFPGDLGSVVVLITSDPCRAPDDVKIEVQFFQKDEPVDLPFEHEFREEVLRMATLSMAEAGWVGPSLVRSLFSEDLRQVIYNRGFHISVNPGYLTEAKLHPLSDVDDMPLYLERE
jgi:hypothetical protein